ncbi:Plus-end-directed kinesin ATPase [Bertholletia excelsa]
MLGDIEGGTRRHSVNCGMTPRVFEYLFTRIQKGASNRKVAATNMNHASSRSHSVFTCVIESRWESQGVTHHRFARLNLVDLAGSERQKSSGAEGERLKEATNINKSLSTLGLVIMNLVSISNGKSLHVPYRDSKLTFLLQDSLGGNSKTIIIANVSPSSSCSLETLSTLKFAQRAKFIKNHAIVNEDASGDVLAMRVQIQHLKKEVSRLRGLLNGGAENHEMDGWMVACPGSPGSFKWEGLHGSLSPLKSDKMFSQKKDYEVALVGSFRREKDKDVALQALAAENQAALQLAKQREDEIQGLKMRLRFREAGIKRLETVASGKMSAEAHLLKEKEEHLKEIEVLRAQVDRNQEVTKFAMENLRLKEEIRRLKSFCEEGERERMNEQIMILQNKLLEALDWKLMHELDPSIAQQGNSDPSIEKQNEVNLSLSSQELGSPWRTSVNEENEFLRMQAIQNESEINMLRKKLNFCLEEKDKLERHAKDLETELQAERSFKAQKECTQQSKIEPLTTDWMPKALNDQIELQAMVDAIATASQREAEAHETAIVLSKENEELRVKLKVLIDDNNKLIELYERAVSENSDKSKDKVQNGQEYCTEDRNHFGEFAEEKREMQSDIANLKLQLMEMHEENEKLMVLYEKAMQERDEFKRILNNVEVKGEFNCPEKLVEVDGGDCHHQDECPVPEEAHQLNKESGFLGPSLLDGALELKNPIGSCEIESLMERVNISESNVQDASHLYSGNYHKNSCLKIDEPPSCTEASSGLYTENQGECFELEKVTLSDEGRMSVDKTGFHISDVQAGSSLCAENAQTVAQMQIEAENYPDFDRKSIDLVTVKVSEDLDLARTKLDRVHEKLLNSAETVMLFASIEKASSEVDNLSREIEAIQNAIKIKQQEHASVKVLSCDMNERVALIDRKLLALKYSLSSFSSSVGFFEKREAQARARVNSSLSYLDRKKEALACLQARKKEIQEAQNKFQVLGVELTSNLANLKSKLEEENQRQENEKVLFAIDNIEKTDLNLSQRNWHLHGKASELLKFEEEKTKTQLEVKKAQEKLGVIRKEGEDLNKQFRKVENEMQVVQTEIQKGLKSVEEMESKLQAAIQEKDMLLEMKENGNAEVENIILDYHQHIFEAELKEQEMKIMDEELQVELDQLMELQKAKDAATEKRRQLLKLVKCDTCLEEIKDIRTCIQELKSLLADDN